MMEYSLNFDNVWTYLGLFCLSSTVPWVIAYLIPFCKIYVCRPFQYKKYKGNWALVTGCTDGIGKFTCYNLASHGINLVLVSRNEKKLKAVGELCRKMYKVQYKTIVVDFKKDPEEEYCTKVAEGIKDLRIDLLFNMVGLSPLMIPWKTFDPVITHEYIKTGIASMNNMTALVLPKMVERKCGVVVNMGSQVSKAPIPFFASYSGTRAFIKTMTECCNYEYADQGVIFHMLYPGLVSTKTAGIPVEHLDIPCAILPDRYVPSAISGIGTNWETSGHWLFDIEYVLDDFLFTLVPDWFTRWSNVTITKAYREFMDDQQYDYETYDRRTFGNK